MDSVTELLVIGVPSIQLPSTNLLRVYINVYFALITRNELWEMVNMKKINLTMLIKKVHVRDQNNLLVGWSPVFFDKLSGLLSLSSSPNADFFRLHLYNKAKKPLI